MGRIAYASAAVIRPGRIEQRHQTGRHNDCKPDHNPCERQRIARTTSIFVTLTKIIKSHLVFSSLLERTHIMPKFIWGMMAPDDRFYL